MSFLRVAGVALLPALFMLAGCGAAIVRDIPISLQYAPSARAPVDSPAGMRTIGLGRFTDARPGPPTGAMGERIRFNNDLDRYQPRRGISGAIRGILRGYFNVRKIPVLESKWSGTPQEIWGEKGDIVISGRVLKLWFSANDFITMGRASSVFQIEVKAGSPKRGTIITKTIQIEPKASSNTYWEAEEVSEWLSKSISEALDRILPDIERRLAE